ncbi:hypothetical protein AX16_007699 [Volvariella volvacea WC 439]|nr:hypothetical protein AX16_007699 [Volvariella volvacea WC 439]
MGQNEPLPASQELENAIEILNLILSYADRWHTVEISLRSRFPPERILQPPKARNLFRVRGIVLTGWESTSRDQIWDVVNSSPELRKATWMFFMPSSTPLSQLKEADIMTQDIQLLEDVLPRLANLTALALSSSPYEGASSQQTFSGKLISLPLLRVLRLLGSCHHLLDRIEAPSLQKPEVYPSHRLETRINPPHSRKRPSRPFGCARRND